MKTPEQETIDAMREEPQRQVRLLKHTAQQHHDDLRLREEQDGAARAARMVLRDADSKPHARRLARYVLQQLGLRGRDDEIEAKTTKRGISPPETYNR